MKTFDKYEKRGSYHYSWYEKNTFHYKDHVDKILSYLSDKGSVLDIGCGDGLISHKLHAKGHSVVGVDTNELAIKYAKEKCDLITARRSKILFVNKSIYNMNMGITYSYVICHDVLEHLPNPEEAIQIMYEVCNKFCIITTPDANVFKPSAYDNKLWNKEGIVKLFRDYKYEYVNLFDTFFIKLIKS